MIPKVTISFSGLLTMVDGKVTSELTNGKTQSCSVCDATGPEMAKNTGPFTPVSQERLQFGISPLHFVLRTFELLLHIAYKQDIKKFYVRDSREKAICEKRTIQVKEAFKSELGLTVDKRREGGFGNTNTGNVCRKAFENPVKTAKICGVSPMLVSNLDIIRRTLASTSTINIGAFESYCQETLQLYMSEVGWYNIPPTLHRVLVHGGEIIRATPINIGSTSEESAEGNTKFARRFYKHHTRKNSHGNALADLLFRLLDVSDPFLSCAETSSKKSKSIPEDMKPLLCPDNLEFKISEPSLHNIDSSDNESYKSDSSENDISFNVSIG